MALAAPKVSLHLYINNPYGLISATIPHYSVNAVDVPKNVRFEDVQKDGNQLNSSTPLPDIKRVTPSVQKPDESADLSSCSSEVSKRKIGLDGKPVQKKTSKKKKNAQADEVKTNQALGITWSMNIDKRDKVLSPRKPPPPTLLEKLGRMKMPEPVGVIKLRQTFPATFPTRTLPTVYSVQKLQLNDKGQRKMNEKLSEWLDQYNEISARQQNYLSRIHDLRRGLQNQDEKRVVVTIDNMRAIQKQRYRRKYPVYTMSKMEDTALPHCPKPFPNRPCLFHAEDGQKDHKIKIAPRNAPRKLAPIVKKVNSKQTQRSFDVASSEESTPRPEMSKMKTEYEPFESIAKRNKLSLTQFFNSGLSHRRTNRRQPLNVSTVTIINEVASENEPAGQSSPVDFITDLSSKKSFSNKGKDGKPD